MSVAIETAAQMILDLCGGEASEPVISGDFPADGYPNATMSSPTGRRGSRASAGSTCRSTSSARSSGGSNSCRVDADDPASWLERGQPARREASGRCGGRGVLGDWRPTWRPRHRRRGRHRRGNRAHRRLRERSRRRRFRAAEGVAKADRDPRAADRAPGAPRRRRARARRGGDLELHRRGGSGAVRRRAASASPTRSAKR